MAYDWSGQGAFSGRPNHDLFLYVRRAEVDEAGNRSRYAWEARARRISGAVSYDLTAYPWAIAVGPENPGGSHNLDFRSTSSILLGTGETGWIAHAEDGSLALYVAAAMDTSGIFGDASFSATFYTDPITRPRPPSAPGTPVVSDILPTSAVISWTPPADMGTAALVGYEVWWAHDPGFTTGVGSVASFGPTSLYLPGLEPGHDYYTRIRARNGVGLGPYSAATFFRTLSGAYVSDGSSWIPREVYVSDGSSWGAGIVYVSDGSSWIPAG